MKFRTLLYALTMLAVCGCQIGCQEVTNNPSPSITSLSPPTATAGGTGYTLTVNGKGFAPQSVVEFNGVARSGNTLFLGENQVTTLVNPSDISNPGIIDVQVMTPAPGGGTSNIEALTVSAGQSNTPTVNYISPTSTFAGGAGLTLNVYGTNFTTSSVVTLSNSNRTTAYVGSGQLQAAVLSADLDTAIVYNVGVTNPPPGGGASNTVPLTVTNPPPSIALISPLTILVPTSGNNDGTTITISGNGFDLASVVYYNGQPRTTNFETQDEITAALISTDIATGGTFPVTVVNPTPGGGTSNVAGFSPIPGADGLGLPSQVNVSTFGVQANAGTTDTTTSGPVISANGQYMAFASAATNLILGDTNNAADVFLHNTCLNTTSLCTPSTALVSASGTVTQANGPSSEPSVDSSGRYVTFTSTATNLIPGNNRFTGAKEVYFRDTCMGVTTTCTPFTILVSVALDGLTPANSDSFQSSLSPDARYVAYTSAATNLQAPNPGGVQQIFLYDTCNGITGCTPSTLMLSLGTDGTPGNAASMQPALGNNGLYVSFSSSATNLVSSPLPGTQQIFQRSTCVGVNCVAATQLVSTPDGTTAANGISFQPSMSQDGRIVAFASTATNLTSNNTAGIQQVFLRDTCTGVSGCTPATSLVSVAPDGITAGNAASEHPSVSAATEQYVAYASFASNLVAVDTNNLEDVFVTNTCAGASGCTFSTALVSVSAPQGTGQGVQGNGNSLAPALSGDANSVSFISAATNLLPYGVAAQNNVYLAYTTF